MLDAPGFDIRDPLQLADFVRESVIVCDPEGIVRLWNSASVELYGWTQDAAIGRRFDTIFPDEEWPDRLEDSWEGLVVRKTAAGRSVRTAIRRVRRRREDGQTADIVECGSLAEDIKADEAQFSEAEGHYPSVGRLIEHMPIALWQVDARGAGEAFEKLRAEGVTDIRAHLAAHPELVEQAKDAVLVTRANRAAVTLMGGADEQELIRPVRYIFSTTPQAAERVMISHFEGRRNHIEEMRVSTFDGKAIDVLFLVTYPTQSERQDVTFISMLDITDRIRAQAELRQLQADFAHTARISTLGELAASIAHEVRQPLAAIVTIADTIERWLRRPQPDVAKALQLLERVAMSANQANDIIRRIQNLATKQAPVLAPLAMNSVVEDALHFVGQESKEKAIAMKTSLGAGLPDVIGDKVQLQQVVINLLLNSIQAIDQAGAELREVHVNTYLDDKKFVVMSVRDTGPGIPSQNVERVFEGFFTTKQNGMGMGLAICQSIMSSHDGSVEIDREQVGGAHIRVRLPSHSGCA